jgi:hypothetical protein
MAGLCSFNVSTRRLNREGLWANGKDQMSCNAKPVSVGFSHGHVVWWRKDCAMCLVVMASCRHGLLAALLHVLKFRTEQEGLEV